MMEPEYRPPTKTVQAILARCRVEGHLVRLPNGVRCTGVIRDVFAMLGGHWDKRLKGFLFKGIPTEIIYEVIEAQIDWDKLPRY